MLYCGEPCVEATVTVSAKASHCARKVAGVDASSVAESKHFNQPLPAGSCETSQAAWSGLITLVPAKGSGGVGEPEEPASKQICQPPPAPC